MFERLIPFVYLRTINAYDFDGSCVNLAGGYLGIVFKIVDINGSDEICKGFNIAAAFIGLQYTKNLYNNYQEMLTKENLDIVSVCTTSRIRATIVKDVARAGVKAIWAEKPISLSLAEADAMVATCRTEGVALAINCVRRWNPFFSEARRLIDADEIGNVLQVTVYAQCGLSHNGSHAIDILRYMAGGNVKWVFCEMESDEAAADENDLSGNGYLVFDNGVRAYLRSTACGAAPWEVDVIGTTGRTRSIFRISPYHKGLCFVNYCINLARAS